MFGNFVSLLIILLFPVSKPKRTFFVCILTKCILMMMLILGKNFKETNEIYFYFIMFGIGLTKAVATFPKLIVSKEFYI